MEKLKTFHIITIGCQMNKSDSERIAGFLENNGLINEPESKKADIVIITTCGVRQSAESRIYGLVPKIKKQNPAVTLVITGCLSERDDVKKRIGKHIDVWLPIKELSQFGYKLGIEKEGVTKEYNDDYLKFNPTHNSIFSAFVPIGNGCNNYCTYCVVPYARGPEKYRDSADIMNEVRELVDRGFKEITLIAQNVNSYSSGDVDFSKLLKKVNDIKGDFWLRFATSHPKDMSDNLIEVMRTSAKICEHLHLPAQSGDNYILTAMNRNYTVEHYKELIDKIKKAIPVISLTTDIIVGFPGETDVQFNNTAKLFKYVNYDMAYIAQFSPRPGTEANKMNDDISRSVKKQREETLNEILRKSSTNNNKKYLNKTVEVLMEGKNKKGILYGKTRTAKVVRVAGGDKKHIGEFVKVKIGKTEDFGFIGEII